MFFGTVNQKHQVEYQVELSDKKLNAPKALNGKPLTRKEIFAAIGFTCGTRAFNRHIEPLIAAGLIEMTIPEKPNSRMQKYRLTHKGKILLADDRDLTVTITNEDTGEDTVYVLHNIENNNNKLTVYGSTTGGAAFCPCRPCRRTFDLHSREIVV